MDSEGYLTDIGAATEFSAGVAFWNRYGRTLFNASVGQVSYNATAANGTARPKPVLRTTSQSRIENSQINWALGFFGTSFQITPQPSLQAFGNGSLFDVVIIPEGGTENNTLASYDSCFNDDLAPVSELGDLDLLTYSRFGFNEAMFDTNESQFQSTLQTRLSVFRLTAHLASS